MTLLMSNSTRFGAFPLATLSAWVVLCLASLDGVSGLSLAGPGEGDARRDVAGSALHFGPAVVAVGDSTTHIAGLGDLPSVLRLVLAEGDREGVDFINFVLIAPKGGIAVADEKVEVTPFYIATTELSVGVARAVWPPSRGVGAIYSTPAEEYYKFYQQTAPMSVFERIRNDDSMPYMPDSLDHLATVMGVLSLQVGLPVRLPTVAEWIAAADVDDEDLVSLVGQARSEPDSLWASHLQPIASGTANRNELRNVWGNVSELVRPSVDEAVILSRTIRNNARQRNRVAQDDMRLNGVAISPSSLLYLGGSVDDTHEDMIRSCNDLELRVPHLGTNVSFLDVTGVRLVLDLTIAVRNAGAED